MSAGQRIAILVGAVVILAGAFVIARGSDDEGECESARSTQEVQSTPEDGTVTSEGTGGSAAPGTTTETQEAPPPPRVETVRIVDGGPAGDAKTITFDNGDTVRLRFRSQGDAPVEIHLHGYDKTVNVPAGGSGRLTFKANAEGKFEIENEGTGVLLAELEVQP